MPTLVDLPGEVITLLAIELETKDFFNLRCTCKDLSSKSFRQFVGCYFKTRRVKMWISQQTCLPEGFLFTKGPRLREPGWRWAPALVHQSAIVSEDGVDREPGDTSLRVVKPGYLIFAGGSLVSCRAFGFKERQSSQRYRVRLDTEYLPAASGGLSADGTLGPVLAKAGFDIKIGNGYYAGSNGQEAGALIQVTSHSGGVISGAFICTVEVRLEDSNGSGDGPGIVLGRSVATSQVWTVT